MAGAIRGIFEIYPVLCETLLLVDLILCILTTCCINGLQTPNLCTVFFLILRFSLKALT